MLKKVKGKTQSLSLPSNDFPSISEKRKEEAHSPTISPLMTLRQEELDKYLSITIKVNECLDPIYSSGVLVSKPIPTLLHWLVTSSLYQL